MKKIIVLLLVLFATTVLAGNRPTFLGGKLADVGECDQSGVCVISEAEREGHLIQVIGLGNFERCEFAILFKRVDGKYRYWGIAECIYPNDTWERFKEDKRR